MSLLDYLTGKIDQNQGAARKMGLLDYAQNMSSMNDMPQAMEPAPAMAVPQQQPIPTVQEAAQAQPKTMWDMLNAPKGKDDAMRSMMSNPMLHIGLGILANNTGNYGAFAPAIGRGALQGMNQAQEMQSAFTRQDLADAQLNGMRQQQDKTALRDKLTANLDYTTPEGRKAASDIFLRLGDPETADHILKFGRPALATGMVWDETEQAPKYDPRYIEGQVKIATAKAGANPPNLQVVPPTTTTPGYAFNPRTGIVERIQGLDARPEAPPKLKPVPASVLQAYTGNSAAIKRIDDVIATIKQSNASDHLGMKNYLPSDLLNYVDPDGVPLRASIADIGSQIIHDRSGAAVTAAEFPRLAPFVPIATDNPETSLKKLTAMRERLSAETDALTGFYTPDQGFEGIGEHRKPPTAAAPATTPNAGTPAPNSPAWKVPAATQQGRDGTALQIKQNELADLQGRLRTASPSEIPQIQTAIKAVQREISRATPAPAAQQPAPKTQPQPQAQPLPYLASGKPDTMRMKHGQLYVGKDGSKGRWNANTRSIDLE
ncbi:hypothetical protein HQ393_10385 [Chitinibacter bivalviorum]|uniref:Uncharacterized protein n=1 Tax=Chitinibacter bivalviorum TaxID=2739434 RepID=A0A7H9BKS4_9NEIS|nr:hypothetical protein [Chitinibacter bivalviorum]QLG88611.1 hypothetical protein HQ393_10385 [Chitinibacter bivalviorum]